MKNLLIETENVRKAEAMVSKIKRAKGANLVAITGVPGSGKSHFARKTFAKDEHGYYRIETMDSPKTFLQEIYRSLNFRINHKEDYLHTTSANLAKGCIKLFQRVRQLEESYIFYIDEVNLAIQGRRWQILELIRDFRDKGNAKIIMIGEHDTIPKLQSYNSHFFDRCSHFCNFETLTIKEMYLIALQCLEVEADKDVLAAIVKESRNSLHHLEAVIKELESFAKSNGINRLTMEQLTKKLQEQGSED